MVSKRKKRNKANVGAYNRALVDKSIEYNIEKYKKNINYCPCCGQPCKGDVL